MKYLIFLLIIPSIAFTQKVNENWITPIANIEFSNTKIIYSYSLDECISFVNIHPVHYNPAIMEMRGVIGTGCINDCKDMFSQIHSYLEEWNYTLACNKDKYNFLKATSLLLIWDLEREYPIPGNTLEILGYLENDMSVEIAKDTKLVLKLYNYYHGK